MSYVINFLDFSFLFFIIEIFKPEILKIYLETEKK